MEGWTDDEEANLAHAQIRMQHKRRKEAWQDGWRDGRMEEGSSEPVRNKGAAQRRLRGNMRIGQASMTKVPSNSWYQQRM